MANPLKSARFDQREPARPIIQHTGDFPADWLATANAHCTRRELEWYRDSNGNMHLGYRSDWSREQTQKLERIREDERQRFIRNQRRIAAEDA